MGRLGFGFGVLGAMFGFNYGFFSWIVWCFFKCCCFMVFFGLLLFWGMDFLLMVHLSFVFV